MTEISTSILYAQAPLTNGAGIELPEAPTKLPQITPDEQTTKGEGWIVTVFNNDTNTYDEVMFVLMLATSCTSEEAYIETWEIDHYGKCVVHRAGENECKKAADVISTIGIKVEATPEE